jgi:GTPase SAR1 family protein
MLVINRTDSNPICKTTKNVYGVLDKGVGETRMTTSESDPFRLAVNKETERQILYITGQSGSGKSYFTRQFIEDYHKAYPKRNVFVFSSLSDDTTLDKLKYLKRIKIKEDKFLNTPLSAEDFQESLTIFDDCDCITNKVIKKKIFDILNSILETGRHFKTSCVFTSHNANAGLDTKRILNESHSITIFPRNMGNRQIKYLLGEYLGFDKNQVKKLKKCEGRWVTVVKSYPMIFFSNTEMFIKDSDD